MAQAGLRGTRKGAVVIASLLALGALPPVAGAGPRDRSNIPGRRSPRVPDKLPAAAKDQPGGAPQALTTRSPLSGAAVSSSPAGAPAPEAREYADSLEALSPAAAARERSMEANYAYCIRVVATYENVYFDRSGELRRAYFRAVQHGTGFAYRRKDGETLVATNDHLANMPEVTGPESALEGVPPGSRKVRESAFIVRAEDDTYAPGFVELKEVVRDPANDLAILKTREPLVLLPYRMGRSADLKVGNAVFARGYPLGVLAASNVGRVTSVLHKDQEGHWSHVDFVTDAALNVGSSGSPVMAISKLTGEPELVGIFHAQYRNATGMSVVVGIDQIREVLETLRPASVASAEEEGSPEQARQVLAESAGGVYFPFAGLTARATPLSKGIRFEIFDDFPTTESAQVVLVSAPGQAFLELGSAGVETGQASLQEPVNRLEAELSQALSETARLRRAIAEDDGSAEAHRRVARLRRRLGARAAEQKQLLSVVRFETEGALGSERAGAAALPRR